MKYWISATCALLITFSASAVTIYECVDSTGAKSFNDRCPAGTTKVSAKKLRGDRSDDEIDLTEIALDFPVTFYSIPECDACDLVRNQLEKRKIPFSEKSVADDIELQTELKAIADGLTVPTVSIAEQVFKGYNKHALDSALTEAGYPDPRGASNSEPDEDD